MTKSFVFFDPTFEQAHRNLERSKRLNKGQVQKILKKQRKIKKLLKAVLGKGKLVHGH